MDLLVTNTIHQSTPESYSTRDIYLGTVLKASGVRLLKIENHQGKGFFVFENCPQIEEIILKYHNNELKLDAKKLFSVWKDLKSLAFSATTNQNGEKNGYIHL